MGCTHACYWDDGDEQIEFRGVGGPAHPVQAPCQADRGVCGLDARLLLSAVR